MIFSFKKLVRSFGFALRGLKSAVGEQTFRIFCFIALIVLVLMFVFQISLYEKIILILTITLVMTLELINSRIERILDIFQPHDDPQVKIVKDISAGAVLLASAGAAIIGVLIFLPYFL